MNLLYSEIQVQLLESACNNKHDHMFSFGLFSGVLSLNANVSEHSVSSIFIGESVRSTLHTNPKENIRHLKPGESLKSINMISEINALNLCFRRQKESLGNLESVHVRREFHAAVWCCLRLLRTCAGILVTRLKVSCRR
jgi:hypothetical protein